MPAASHSRSDPSARQSAPAGWLRALSRPAVALGVLAALAVGMVLGGPFGTVLLIAGIALLLMMLALGWRAMTGSERLLRIALLVFVIALTIVRLVPR